MKDGTNLGPDTKILGIQVRISSKKENRRVKKDEYRITNCNRVTIHVAMAPAGFSNNCGA